MQERTKAGQEAARLRGRMLGRPAGLSPKLAKKAKAITAIYPISLLDNQLLLIVQAEHPASCFSN